MTSTQRQREDSGFETLTGIAAGIFVGLAVSHWLAANLAALLHQRRPLDGAGLVAAGEALINLPDHWGDPRHAWPKTAADQLPGPVGYWFALIVVLITALITTLTVLRWHTGRKHQPVDKRRRLGVDTQARLATTRDLRPLLARTPEPGRLVIGRWRRRYLLTEGPTARRRRGVQGALAVFGPSQSGKTTGLLDSVHHWNGPAIISSVKTDILHATRAHRAEIGDVTVFDPLGITCTESASWSPVDSSIALHDAIRTANALTRANGHQSTGNDRFWRGQAEQLLAAMLWTAANTENQTMRDVVRWVLDFDHPSDDSPGTLAPLVRLLTDNPDPDIAFDAKVVQGWLHGQWTTDPRTTSSVYATARDAVWPWGDSRIVATAETTDITLDWLLDGANTLYLVAPLGDENRAGAVFTVLLGQLLTDAFDRTNCTGPLDDRLLLLLDETANTPHPDLPEWASTITGAGIQLVTVWQSLAQMQETYGRQADTLLTNHRTKLGYLSGTSDPTSTDYFAALAGTEHVRSDLDGLFVGRDERPGVPAAGLPLLDGPTLRAMDVGDACCSTGTCRQRGSRPSADEVTGSGRLDGAKLLYGADSAPRVA